ncbi:hypothetical protein QYF36_025917 [Acer negundo]|nr:hypothetical protein QYF36_025917 [Acer negundo]
MVAFPHGQVKLQYSSSAFRFKVIILFVKDDDDDETHAMNIDNESGDENLSNERSELLRRGAIGKGVIGNGTREEELLRRSDRNEELLRRGALGDGFDGDDIADQILI